LSIDRVSFLNFEQFLYIKFGLLKFRIVSKRKKNKKVSQKYENFQISGHKCTTSIGQHVSL